VPGIKFWTDGTEMGAASRERPLTDAERSDLERQQHLSKWLKLVEGAAGAAAALSAVIWFLGGDRILRQRCHWAVVACGGLALAARFVANRRE
jgi:hypothetical protein